MADDLLGCPFCGSEAKIVEATECGPQAYVVACQDGMCAASSQVIYALKDDVRQQLIDCWNRRALTPGAVERPIPLDDKVVSYILRYGGRCRDCADQNGICPGSGLPCDGAEKAVRHVISAYNYGVEHGFLSRHSVSPPPGDAVEIAGKAIAKFRADECGGCFNWNEVCEPPNCHCALQCKREAEAVLAALQSAGYQISKETK